MITRIAPLLKLALAVATALLLLDVLAFRSGAYTRWIEPNSTAGSVVGATLSIEHQYVNHEKNVLVLGNSQIGEGFSARVADASIAPGQIHFINGSVPGTSLRVWNYLLREVDPEATRFAAIVMMVDYEPGRVPLDLNDYPLDTSYLTPLLRLSDLDEYSSSFGSASLRAQAARAILLPLQALHEDLLAFAREPFLRIRNIVKVRPGWLQSIEGYTGHAEALPQFEIDPVTREPRDWSAIDPALRSRLEGYFRALSHSAVDPGREKANDAYQNLWLGRIVDRYQKSGVPVIAFAVPRGPWQRTLVPVAPVRGTLAALRDAQRIVLLPGDAFIELEQPQYFFDTLHMNRVGREQFSSLFAHAIAPLVH